MDKNIIKKHLTEKFLKEYTTPNSTPAISLAKKLKKDDGKVNKDGVKAVEKDMAEYDKALKQEDKGKNTMAINKYNYTNDGEKQYHDEMETLNGLEMNKYTSEPGEEFRGRAQKAMEGDSTMGNAVGGNAEPAWDASKKDFGKDLAKRVRDSEKKRDDAFIATYELGDKIMALPADHKVKTNDIAIGKAKVKTTGDNTQVGKSQSQKIKTVKENETITPNKQTTESMKRLRFKKEFNGVGNALKLIPESYKTDKKEFEMTDGNETYRIRWEGTLAEGRAIVLRAADKKMVNEDIDRMKALFNYKSENTLGLVKGKDRIDENKAFADVYAKTKKLLGEEENIEDVKPVEDNLDDAGITQAPEAKKHVEGSVPTDKKTNAPEPKKGNWEEAGKKGASVDKGTKAPAPKEGNWEEAKTGEKAPVAEAKTAKKIEAVKPKTGSAESIDNAVKHAPEAKKHVEGSVPTDKKTEAKKPKEAPFEEAPIAQASEAKEHVEGSVKTDKKTEAKAKTGSAESLDKAVKQAPEAKKDIATGKGKALAAKAKTKEIAKDVVTEKVELVEKNINEEEEIEKDEVGAEPEVSAEAGEEGGDEETSADKFLKGDEEDNGPDDEKEPETAEIGKEVVPPVAAKGDEASKLAAASKITLLHSPSQNKYFLQVGAGKMVECPEEYALSIKAKKMSKETALEKIEDAELTGVEGGEEDMDEGMFSKSPEQIKAIGMEAIKKHPTKSKVFQSFANDPAKAEKYVMFVGKNPDVMQIKWDEKIQDFVDAAKFSHGMASGA